MRSLVLVVPLLVAGVLAACKSSEETPPAAGDDDDSGGAAQTATPTTPSATPTAPATTDLDAGVITGAAGTGLATGLPCDVQMIIENRCITCHGPTAPTTSAQPPLLSYAQLVAPSTADPRQTRAQLALAFMKSRAMPPPPAVPPADDELTAFQNWVAMGTPQNATACTTTPPLGVPIPVTPPPTDPTTQCVTGTFWQQGNTGSPTMHPGGACNACHQLNQGPNLRVGGTVFQQLHEPNDCNGAQPPITVTIIDSRNRTFQLPVNAAGNFFTQERVRPPIRAQISNGITTRAMNGTVNSGDCNSCHTQIGLNGAPGRIMAP